MCACARGSGGRRQLVVIIGCPKQQGDSEPGRLGLDEAIYLAFLADWLAMYRRRSKGFLHPRIQNRNKLLV